MTEHAENSLSPTPGAAGADVSRRTLLANERTYLAWSRTGLTAFGIAIGIGAIVPAVAGGADYQVSSS